MDREHAVQWKLACSVRSINDEDVMYRNSGEVGIQFFMSEIAADSIKKVYKVSFVNAGKEDFRGVIHLKLLCACKNPKFFMPGYMYNRNTAQMPSGGRKAFPRIKKDKIEMPQSPFFMTRSDRLAEPMSLIYDEGKVMGISAAPYLTNEKTGAFDRFCGFSCNICDGNFAGVGYTLGYENAPWLFVQTAKVIEREPLQEKNVFCLPKGSSYSLELTIYDYVGEDERSIYKAVEDAYYKYHESPRSIPGMDEKKAMRMLAEAIRDYAWLSEEKMYSGFVYDRPEGFTYNKIPSISWTNGLSVAVPMLLFANLLRDEKAREQSLAYIEGMLSDSYNPLSGFLYESIEAGIPSVHGWWYDGMHSGGHSGYINGQAIYYLLKAYADEKEKNNILHENWRIMAGRIVKRMNEVINADYEYPFSMSEETGAGIEYDSMGSVWCLAASALYEVITEEDNLLEGLLKSEAHYYSHFVKKVECYGGPLDTDKAVDSEGILGYIRAVRYLHQMTGAEYLLDHMRDALLYEFTFKLGYNTPVMVPPLKQIGWSGCGGSITSTANPHIHPMSGTIIAEMKYYLRYRENEYVKNRLRDTIGWSLQTFNTKDSEYGYGKVGWMSERFCFCEGLLTERYPDGTVAGTWFALMPWACASLIEGFVRD